MAFSHYHEPSMMPIGFLEVFSALGILIISTVTPAMARHKPLACGF